ncbi:MAG: hypothetical protein HS132_14705 [Planctomycetia bacterium]|nr:hypothetical protein [Planctomycetia bacterium]
MNDYRKKYSLLLYLNRCQSGTYLRPSLQCQNTSILEKTPFPFLVTAESDPLARLVEAKFVTDADSEIQKVFLLVQRDQYLITRNELWPINNRDVEDAWQKAFSFYTRGNQNTPLIILSNQINEKGQLAQMSSLLFCKTKQVFFHPPCPKCGLLLQQCEDDALLTSSGLQSYSQSLKRYLFCPACCPASERDFYVCESDRFDPPSVKDRCALIKEFAQLPKRGCADTQFPCGECPNHQECFGADYKVLTRIAPFSFYPFYMFVFHAMSLNAQDFLSLVSGAPFDDIEAPLKTKQEFGRIHCVKAIRQNCFEKVPFLYDRDERHFLEILYLKLSFLAGLLQNFSSGNSLFLPKDLRLSLDRIWVKLAEQGGFLPFFWNFKVNYIDINRYLTETQSLPKPPASDGLFSFGLVWFYALLVNKQQNSEKVYGFLGEIMDQMDFQDEASFEKLCKEGFRTPLLPENIFWNPEGKAVNKDWHMLWERGLHLGWSLLTTAFRDHKEWSKTFFQKIEDLREEVKCNLLSREKERPLERVGEPQEILSRSEGPKKADVRPPPKVLHKEETVNTARSVMLENRAINEILMKISKKWQTGIGKEKTDANETVTLILKDLNKEFHLKKDKATREVIPETVIITPGKGKKILKTDPIQEELDQTVILSREGLQKERSSEKAKEPQETIPETVIIAHQEVDAEALSTFPRVQPKDSYMNEKVFSSKEKDILEQANKNSERTDEPEFIAETVILKPERIKNKNGNK